MSVVALTVKSKYGFISILPTGFDINLPTDQLKQMFAFMIYNCVPTGRYNLNRSLTWQFHNSIEDAERQLRISGIPDNLIRTISSRSQRLPKPNTLSGTKTKGRLYVTQREIVRWVEGQPYTQYAIILLMFQQDQSYHASVYQNDKPIDNKIIRALINKYFNSNYPTGSSLVLVTDSMAVAMDYQIISLNFEIIGIRIGRKVLFRMTYTTSWDVKVRQELNNIHQCIQTNYTDQLKHLFKLVRTGESDSYHLIQTAVTDRVSGSVDSYL